MTRSILVSSLFLLGCDPVPPCGDAEHPGRCVAWTDPGCTIWEDCCEPTCGTDEEYANHVHPGCDCVQLHPNYIGDCLQVADDECAWVPWDP